MQNDNTMKNGLHELLAQCTMYIATHNRLSLLPQLHNELSLPS